MIVRKWSAQGQMRGFGLETGYVPTEEEDTGGLSGKTVS
jgi:hypothetical protein